MLKKNMVFLFCFIIFISGLKAQSEKNLKEINEVHKNFIKSFELLDVELFAKVHSKDLVRVPGGKRVMAYDEYIEGQKASFTKAKKENNKLWIDLRFIERVNNDSTASERGIYKFVVNKTTPEEKCFYGKFHVILKKEEGEWKFLLDYDSSENKTIGEKDFNNAFAMDDFEKFVKK